MLPPCDAKETVRLTDLVYESWKGQYVEFCVRDVHLPPASEVLDHMHGGDELKGIVVDVSESGREAGRFVVVYVESLRRPCVVAAERVRRVP